MDIDVSKYDDCDLVTLFEKIVIEMQSRFINIYKYIPTNIKHNENNKISTNNYDNYNESLGYY
ncbi:putative ORfan [Saudi moumouvirus]|nr:putative ORfan [Saudi moumouvirus]